MGSYLNLVMSGGGIKGIAYVGMFDVAERRGYRWINMAGVSAGALLGAFASSGYSPYEMWKTMETFDFKGFQLGSVEKKVPAVARYMEYMQRLRGSGQGNVFDFLSQKNPNRGIQPDENSDIPRERNDFLNNIITYTKEGALFDGDYLEEWVAKKLAAKGIRTFADLRGGRVDKVNPGGYKLRVTGVDVNRAKLVVLPDDALFYGIEPDKLEVAKAVRISTCVPFAFKPVVFTKKEGNRQNSFNLVDGGVFDRFPYFLVDNDNKPTVGFKLSGGEKPNFFSVDTPLNILKALISAVQDIGIPKDVKNEIKYIGEIDTTKVYYLDFNLTEQDNEYLFNAGRQTAIMTFNKMEGRRLKGKWFGI